MGEERQDIEVLFRLTIYENAWMVAKTGKPIASIPLESSLATDLRKMAQEIADNLDIKMEIVVSHAEGADVEFPAAQMLFYREQVILDTYKYLEGDTAFDLIPDSVRDCLWGLLYGYRSDAIQQFVDWQASRWGDTYHVPYATAMTEEGYKKSLPDL